MASLEIDGARSTADHERAIDFSKPAKTGRQDAALADLLHCLYRPDRFRYCHPAPAALCREIWRLGPDRRTALDVLLAHAIYFHADLGEALRSGRTPANAHP